MIKTMIAVTLSAVAGLTSSSSFCQEDNLNQVEMRSMPVTGNRISAMDGFDRSLAETMYNWKVPGAAVAVINGGKLVYSRGYGYADIEKKIPVLPDSVFRIASVSKILTAVAVLQLIEDGKLTLETKVFPLLKLGPETNPHKRRSPLLDRITVRHLLECSAGWDRKYGDDPVFMPSLKAAAYEYSNSLRPTADSIIRHSCLFLDYEPGSQFAYSNVAYTVLGKLIEKISGQKYQDYIQSKLLKPMELKSIKPGKTLKAAEKEVHYYGYPGEMDADPVVPNIRGKVPMAYGGEFYLEASTAEMGWISSVIDIAWFVSKVLGDCGSEQMPLSKQMTELMLQRPNVPVWVESDSMNFFALGWEIENDGLENRVIKKEGCFSGSTCIAYHMYDTTLVVAFNSRPQLTAEFQDQVRELISDLISSRPNWRGL